MSYYGGGYQRGDYYRGDPFLGALAGAAVGAIGKLAGKAAGWVGKQVSGSRKVTQTATGAVTVGGGVLSSPILREVALPALGGAAVGGGITAVTRMLTGGGEKKKYRRMNPLNPKALKRALRRAEGFEQFAKRTVNALYKTSSCGCSKKSRKFKRS